MARLCSHGGDCHGAGQEIWEQTGGQLDAFVCGAGTGGTIAGISHYLKSQKPGVQIHLVDPPGSSLHNKVSPTFPLWNPRWQPSYAPECLQTAFTYNLNC